MKSLVASFVLAAGLGACALSFAQAPAAAPAGSTGACKDGTYTSKDARKGSCAGHKGVKEWYGPVAAAGTSPKPADGASAASTTVAAPPAAAVAPAAKPKTDVASMAAAPGGGAGQVWVNPTSKVYHCAGSKYYGKTKQGSYMTEAAAKAAGDHADHGKACAAS